MIIFGTNSKNLKQAPLEAYECPNCKTKNSVLAIIADYFHLFWIPVFPYKKTTYIVCQQCEFSQTESKLPPELKAKVKSLKSAVSLPKYMFSGSVLLVIAAAFIFYSVSEESKKELAYIANPQIGDVYVLKDFEEKTTYNHYLLKVIEIVDDSLHVTFNSYSYDGVVDRLDPKDGFYDVSYSMHKTELSDFKNSGKLKKVIRDYKPYAGFDKELEYQFLEENATIIEEEAATQN